LNLGAKESRYDYICYLSADCFPEKDWLCELETEMEKSHADVVQGMEIPSPMNDIHYVLLSEKNNVTQAAKTIYFNNANTLYKKEVLLPYLPFSDIDKQGGEDTVMSLKFNRDSKIAMFVPNAKVHHNMFENIDEFKKRMYLHGKLSKSMLKKFPLTPRIYLNFIFWSIKEFILFVSKKDIRF
jgi:hypothetical protein